MIDAFAAIAAVVVPWAAGCAVVRAIAPRAGNAPDALSLGYGWLVGAFAATLAMRAASLAGLRWSLAALLLALATLGGAAAWVARRRAGTAGAIGPPAPVFDLPRWLFALALALLAFRLAGLAAEALASPLRGYDTWAHWATKARVWFEAGGLRPFVSPDAWLARGDPSLYTDANPGHPGTLPLLQAWVAVFIGRWHDTLVGMPWFAFAVALAAAFYAQARHAGAGPALAMTATWMLLSLPALGAHVAVPGLADLPLATAYGLAAMATWRWARTREPGMAILALACAAAGATMKVEGAPWMATLLFAVATALDRRLGFALAGAAVAAFAGWLAFGPERLPVGSYTLLTRPIDVSDSALRHLFVYGNWHLGAWLVVALAAWRWRRLFSRELAPATMTVAAGIALVVVVFFFTTAAGGVSNETLVTRLPLHMAPVAAFYALLLLLDGAAAAGAQPNRAATYAADATR